MRRGKVIRAAGGFFTVLDEESGEYICRARGILKRNQASLMVGDLVVFQPNSRENGGSQRVLEGVIEKLLPRSNRLTRPPVANIEQLVVVMSLREPACDWQLVDRLLVLAEKESLLAFICLNKKDLLIEEELSCCVKEIKSYPYPVLFTSAVSGAGLDEMRTRLADRSSVFAGPSGVGKSSLLNAMQPGLQLKTAAVSEKIKRGKHTTRQAELLLLDHGGSVVDTPGFTRLDFQDIEPDQLAWYFPEFTDFIGQCAFRDCMHLSEPDCAVRREVGVSLNKMRYEHYRFFAGELGKEEAN